MFENLFCFLSSEVKCEMKFGIFLPPDAEKTKFPVLYWLSGIFLMCLYQVHLLCLPCVLSEDGVGVFWSPDKKETSDTKSSEQLLSFYYFQRPILGIDYKYSGQWFRQEKMFINYKL